MKLLLCLLFAPFFSFAQNKLPEKDGKVIYEEVDSMPGIEKDELYSRSKIWLVNTFKSAKDVVQLDDKQSGQLIGKGNFQYEYVVLLTSGTWICSFTLQIDCRGNKARIKIYDISSRSAGEATAEYFNKHNAQKHIKPINENIVALLADFKASLKKPSSDNF